VIAVDSSAIVAILFGEAHADPLLACLASAPPGERYLSVVSYVETGTVLAGRAQDGDRRQAVADLDAFLDAADIQVHGVDEAQMRLAMTARIEHGKGFGKPAGLNFGDCFSYALAKALDAPLLYVGNDFTETDLTPALRFA